MIDAHAHINDDKLIERSAEIAANLRQDNINAVIVSSCDIKSSKDAVILADKFKSYYATVGTHPHEAKYYGTCERDFYKSVAENPKVVAIGEIGLDYYYEYSERDVQKRVFSEQLELADELKLPVVLHVRDAYLDAFDILKSARNYLNNGILLHCYSGSKEMIAEFNKFDVYYSFGGVVTFASAKKEEIIRAIPLNRLLVETDSPYLAPVPLRGRTNEPKYMVHTLKRISDILNVDYGEIDEITTENTCRLFRKIIL